MIHMIGRTLSVAAWLIACTIRADLDLQPATVPTLVGPHAGQQLAISRPNPQGHATDISRKVTYRTEPVGFVSVTSGGYVQPIKNGKATVIATSDDMQEVRIAIEVQSVEAAPPINFPNDIVPLFTKHGCNGGGCHGKADGQNGFRLSLFGYEPQEDYEHLVHEARGRRLFPAAPEHSLIVQKAVGDIPHGGGTRMELNSYATRMLSVWMKQGMPYGKAEDPTITHISVFPKERIMQPHSEQQLVVTAYYSDGTVRDITRIAEFESNEKEMVKADEHGLVTTLNQTGSGSVMVRFQEYVDVFQAIIPLGVEVSNLPPARNYIDDLVYERLKLLGLPPSGECDDATFIRRVTIDLAGRIPDMEEVKNFTNDTNNDKRTKLIDRLLAHPDYADYFANKWSAILRNKRNQDSYTRGTYTFHSWIRDSLHKNKPYNQFMREVVTATGDLGIHPPVAWYRQVKSSKEQLQDTAQIFLGVRLQCAECHHHPYEKWSQQDYYGFAAFFSRVGRKPGRHPGEEIIYHSRGTASAKNPKTNTNVGPTPLDGQPLNLDPGEDPRKALAEWMADEDNPFFAKMLVNRYWKHFFGRGLVEPEDDIRVTNPASHPKLLNRLADEFVASRYDLKKLCRTITESQIYQLTAIPNDYNLTDKQNYSRYYPKRLSAEVLLDAIDTVTGKATTFSGLPPNTRAVQLPDDKFNSENFFLEVFGRPEMDSACECERSSDANLAQTLHLLNSKGIHNKITAGDGVANRIAKDTNRSDEDKLYELYKLAFAREPVTEEMTAALDYLKGKEADQRTEAYQDIMWALINTKEFLFNH